MLIFQTPGPRSGSGTQPRVDLGARDIFAEYTLPPIKDQPTDAVWKSERNTQVLSRARALGFNANSATEAWVGAGTTYERGRNTANAPQAVQVSDFAGSRSSELNTLLAMPQIHSVRVLTADIEMDVPLSIARNDLSLDLGRTHLTRNTGGSYLLQIRNAEGVRVSGGILGGQGWGVLVAGSRRVVLQNMEIAGLSGGGIVVTGSQDVTVWGNRIQGLGAAPLLLHGATVHAVIANNEITDNRGGSNWHAGIVVTDRGSDLTTDPKNLLRDDNYWVKEERILDRLTIPHDNVIAYNHIADNLSSGLYSDGGARNIYAGNRIERNSKEGFCLDNGSTANAVVFNTVEGNGKRWGKSDNDLRLDFVMEFGRLPDGSSPAKVPGISIDNAAYNQVMFNEIDRNFGGGIKMVRTGFYNTIGLNTLSDNNEGRSKAFHFFGVELGSANGDSKVIDLDFTPSQGNEVFGNIIRGSHYAGVFFADGSTGNTVFDNTIYGATNWAMESVKPQNNESFNNLTNLKLRNISSGIDPNLLKIGVGEFDKLKAR